MEFKKRNSTLSIRRLADNFRFSIPRGLTLIELLVVMGVLGILSAILFTVLDPLQQKKKANDALAKNTAVEFLQGALRYNTDFSAYPWNTSSACISAPSGPPPTLPGPTATNTPTPPQAFPCFALVSSCTTCPAGYTCSGGCANYASCQDFTGNTVCSGYNTSTCTGAGIPGHIYTIAFWYVTGSGPTPTPTPTPIPTTPTPIPLGMSAILTPVPLTALSACITTIASQGDVKSTFNSIPASTLQSVYLTQPNPVLTPSDSNSIVVCYFPTSQSGQKDVQAKYTQNGLTIPPSGGINGIFGYDQTGTTAQTSGTCLSEDGNNYCYVCVY